MQVYNSAINVLPLQRVLVQETLKMVIHGKLMEDETVQMDLVWTLEHQSKDTLYYGLLSNLDTQWPDTMEARRISRIIKKKQQVFGTNVRDLKVLCIN